MGQKKMQLDFADSFGKNSVSKDSNNLNLVVKMHDVCIINMEVIYGTKYSRMDQVNFVEDSV